MLPILSAREFFRGAQLNTIIPENSQAKILAELEQIGENEDEDSSPLLRIKQRNILFFDETLTVYVALKVANISADLLKSYLPRLDIKIDVWVTNASQNQKPQGLGIETELAPVRDLVFTGPVQKNDDPIVMLSAADGDDEDELSMLVLFETSITLNRPRLRFQTPVVSIIASGTVIPEESSQTIPKNDYLPSFEPTPANILGPLSVIPGLQESPPFLARSRLERVLPIAPAEENAIRIRYNPSKSFRVVPALIARLRFAHAGTSPLTHSRIAYLEIEVIPFVEIRASLENVKVVLANGQVEPLLETAMPLACQSKDCINLIYRLNRSRESSWPIPLKAPNESGISSSDSHTLSVSLSAKIFLSTNCHSKINMEWSTNLDLPIPLAPSLAVGPPTRPIQPGSRPDSLQFASSPVLTHRLPNAQSAGGISMSFTSPSTPVQVGQPFSWQVLVVNHSTTRPVRLAIIPIPRIPPRSPLLSQQQQQQQTSKSHAPKSSNASFHPTEKRHTRRASEEATSLACAVCDENVVFALQHAHPNPMDTTDVVSLTAELRVGPLGPGTCYEGEMRMVVLRQGTVSVDVVRVVDLVREAEEGSTAPGVVIDITELPVVMAV